LYGIHRRQRAWGGRGMGLDYWALTLGLLSVTLGKVRSLSHLRGLYNFSLGIDGRRRIDVCIGFRCSTLVGTLHAYVRHNVSKYLKWKRSFSEQFNMDSC